MDEQETTETDRTPAPGEGSPAGGVLRTPVRALKRAVAIVTP